MSRRIQILMMVFVFILCGWIQNAVFAAENRGHAAPASILPNDLKKVAVKDYFIASNNREVGAIQTVIAHVIVARADLSQAYFAANGDKLYEKDVIFTLAGSKCRLKLHNDDVITLGDNTRLALKEVEGDRNTPQKKSTMSVARGKAMFYAIRLLKHKGLSMTVESPTAVVGVRGTKFGMEVSMEDDKAFGAMPLMLADASEDWGRYLLAQANQPRGITTTVHGFDGIVSVTSTVTGATSMVRAGQSLATTDRGIGRLMPTPPEVSRRFQSQTNVPPPTGAGAGAQAPAGGSGGGQTTTGDSGTTPSTTSTAKTTNQTTTNLPDTSTVTQNQVIVQEEKKAAIIGDAVKDPRANASGQNAGYFTTMLTNKTGGKLEEVFISKNRYLSSGNIWARGIAYDQDFVRASGSGQQFSSGTPYVNYVNFGGNSKTTGDLASNYPVTVGSPPLYKDTYLELGYATVPKVFTVGGNDYVFDNKTYYIFGYNTPALSGFSGTATYKGNAYGTYWSSTGGTDMTGIFSTNVNFTSASLSNFNMNVSSSTAKASITGASGTIGSDTHTTISGGTWDLNGVTPDQQSAVGSLYGPAGTSFGGAWSMYSTSENTGAVGNYQGIKGSSTPPPADTVIDPRVNASSTSTQNAGYFAAMLTNQAGGNKLEEVFISKNRYLGDSSSNVWGRGIANDSDFVRAMGSTGSQFGSGTPYLKYVTFAGGTKLSGDLGSAYPITTQVIGKDSYTSGGTTEWGYALIPNAFTVDNQNYIFDNKIYYIFGVNPPSLSGFSGTATYSGSAYGTYWTAAGGTDMTGTFSTNVNFTSAAVSNFNLSVGNGSTTTASITGASGTMGQDAHVAISGGNWNLNGVTPDKQSASGSLYGPSAESFGGVWSMYSTSANTGAVGNYIGTKGSTPPPPTTSRPGFITGMLERTGNIYVDTYISTVAYDLASNSAIATSPSGLAYESGVTGTPSMVMLTVGSNSWIGNQALSTAQTGSTSNMQWGTWTQPTAMTMASTDYYFANQGWYIWGNQTSNAQMDTLKQNQITANYSGNAYGTYFTAGGPGTRLSGTFGATINFASLANQISNFGLTVTGGGNSVQISGAQGTFIGSGASTLAAYASQFIIDQTTGSWKINGNNPITNGSSASGSVYGSTGEEIGGDWRINDGTNRATGIFEGGKQAIVIATDPVADPATNRQGTSVGYFAAMLSNKTANSLEEIFVSKNRYDGTGDVWARGTKSSTQDYMRLYGNTDFGGTPYLKWTTFQSGTKNSGDLASAQPLTSTRLGSTSDYQWGYATLPTVFSVSNVSYGMDNRAYWIFGNSTASMSGLSGTASYNGTALGSYWSSAGGVNLSGTFSTDVNFTSASVSNFNLNVASGATTASITGASGSIGSDAHFNLSGGTWNLNGTTPDQTSASGSLYGSTASSMGGAWGMYSSTANTGAAGIYYGSKPATDPTPDPGTNASGTKVGYFAAMLTNKTSSTLEEVFVSKNRYDLSSDVWARGTKSSTLDYMRLNGNGDFTSSPYLKWAKFQSGAKDSGDLSTNQPLTSTILLSNSDMTWGYSTMSNSFTVSGTSYGIDNRAYWIFGTSTPSMTGLSGTVSYSGYSYGTYWSSTGGVNMTGNFTTDVNLTSAAVSNFNMSVSGAAATASISNAGGSIGSDAHFNLSGGTWLLNGATPDQTSASGSLYGSTASSIGGAWGMYNSTANTGADGIYHGTQVTGPVAQKGYFASMLQNSAGGYVDTYITSNQQDLATNGAYAMNVSQTSSFSMDGTSTPKKMTEMMVAQTGGTWTGSQPMQFTKMDSNAYMEWGTWTQPNAMTAGGVNYSFSRAGAYVWGDPTTDAQMASLKNSSTTGTYSGTSWGTYFTGGTSGVAMTGTFSANVNFASPAVSTLNVNMSGGGNSASISNAAGSFTGATSNFTISPTSGTWTINSSAATSKAGFGSIYGSAGNAMGGVFSAGTSSECITGGFQGRK
ncbi:MAG: hypothetical protein CSYNP_00657 [Syntrophus sp. SKADARSKE-3]|nr:hypothetical protein [Syntrophus sp. SKADARSKE-3]